MAKKPYNMTGEEIQSNEDLFTENKPYELSNWDVFWISSYFTLFAIVIGMLIYTSNLRRSIDILKVKLKTEQSKLNTEQDNVEFLKSQLEWTQKK